jgi:subtilase family serine protease
VKHAPKMKHARRHIITAALAVTAASALGANGIADASTTPAGHSGRTLLASTAPAAGVYANLAALPDASRVQVSVFVGHDAAGLAATAKAVSDPKSAVYGHYLSPSRVQAQFGASAAQQKAVGDWLSRPRGGVEQVVSAQEMSVPSALAGAVSTVRVAPAAIPLGFHEPLKQTASSVPSATSSKKITEECSGYYGQKHATGLPSAYGKTPTWAPCGYLPGQLRDAYGAAKAGLTGAGVSAAILSDDNDSTALPDANRWAKEHGFAPFKAGQFSAYIAKKAYNGIGDVESALDVESMHGMAPNAKINYVVGNGSVTGDRLLDALDEVVTYKIADVVSSSWYEGYMPAPKSMINAWEGVLERAAVEGITVNFATGDYGDSTPLQYPGSDPWITTVGGTSLAVGQGGKDLWETGWETDETRLNKQGTAWSPGPPGMFLEGSTGGISGTFPEPYYQQGVVSGNVVKGTAMRAVPDVSDLGDWNLGYKIGYTEPTGHNKFEYVNNVNGGTSLASPMFTGFEADLIQGRHGFALGFANPELYDMAGTRAFHDVTSNPQGQGVTEATVYGPAYGQPPTLATMGQCSSTKALSCGAGYDTVSGIGSPGPAFFSSFGSKPQ